MAGTRRRECIIETEFRSCEFGFLFVEHLVRTNTRQRRVLLAVLHQAQICARANAPILWLWRKKRHPILARPHVDPHHGEHRVGTVGARVDRGLGRRAGAHDHDFRHGAAATATTGRFKVKPSDRGRQKIAVPTAGISSMLSSRWLRLRRIPRVTRAIPKTATSVCRLATPRAPLKHIRLRSCTRARAQK